MKALYKYFNKNIHKIWLHEIRTSKRRRETRRGVICIEFAKLMDGLELELKDLSLVVMYES